MTGGNRGLALTLASAVLLAACSDTVEDPDGSIPLLPDSGSDAGRGDAGPGDGGVDAGLPVVTCHSCHGSALSDAPPGSVDGGVDRSLRGVGAHQAHLKDSTWHRSVLCADCHQVPKKTDDPGHLDGLAAVSFSEPTQPSGTSATWNGETCTVWCHSPTRGGGALTQPRWTRSDVSQAYCGDCHGIPPPWPHPQGVGNDCSPCHLDAKPGLGFADPSPPRRGESAPTAPTSAPPPGTTRSDALTATRCRRR